jgi:hypothetical protein
MKFVPVFTAVTAFMHFIGCVVTSLRNRSRLLRVKSKPRGLNSLCNPIIESYGVLGVEETNLRMQVLN